MSKDPAVLFYTSDFLTGTALMSNEQKGIYITLLCLQHQHGHFCLDQLKAITNNDPVIMDKFVLADDGKYHNLRMHEEKLKRSAFCESRRANAKHKQSICSAYAKHMGNHMENENEDENRNEISLNSSLKGVQGEKPKSDFKTVTDHFCRSFKNKFSCDYLFQTKDGVNLSKIFKQYGKDKTIELINLFFDCKDSFVSEAGYSVGIFLIKIPKLLSGGKNQNAERSTDIKRAGDVQQDIIRESAGALAIIRRRHGTQGSNIIEIDEAVDLVREGVVSDPSGNDGRNIVEEN